MQLKISFYKILTLLTFLIYINVNLGRCELDEEVKKKEICKRQKRNGTDTAIFGEISDHKDYPYLVQVIHKHRKKQLLCTGALISAQWVITNSQCFDLGELKGHVIFSDTSEHKYSTVLYPKDKADFTLIKLEEPLEVIGFGYLISRVMSAIWPQSKRYNRDCKTAYFWKEGEEETRLFTDDVTAGVGPNACKCELRLKIRGPKLGVFQKNAICVFGHQGKGCYSFTSAVLYCDNELVGMGHLVYDCEEKGTKKKYKSNREVCDNSKRVVNTYTSIFTYIKWVKSLGVELRSPTDHYHVLNLTTTTMKPMDNFQGNKTVLKGSAAIYNLDFILIIVVYLFIIHVNYTYL